MIATGAKPRAVGSLMVVVIQTPRLASLVARLGCAQSAAVARGRGIVVHSSGGRDSSGPRYRSGLGSHGTARSVKQHTGDVHNPACTCAAGTGQPQAVAVNLENNLGPRRRYGWPNRDSADDAAESPAHAAWSHHTTLPPHAGTMIRRCWNFKPLTKRRDDDDGNRRVDTPPEGV